MFYTHSSYVIRNSVSQFFGGFSKVLSTQSSGERVCYYKLRKFRFSSLKHFPYSLVVIEYVIINEGTFLCPDLLFSRALSTQSSWEKPDYVIR